MSRIVTAPLAGSAYPIGLKGTPQYHIVVVTDDGETISVLCGRVKLGSVLEDATQYNRHKATCRECIKRAEVPT